MRRLAALFAFAVLLLAGCGWFNPLTQITTRSSGAEKAQSAGSACAISIVAARISYNSPLLTAELPDGALIVGSAHQHGSKLVISLWRVDPQCQSHKLHSASIRVGKFGSIDTMVATPQAELLLGGSDGRHALVGRLMATGWSDQTFGSSGWVRIAPNEKPVPGMPPLGFSATSISAGPNGSIFVGGNDGGAHCCARDFVSELTPAGKLMRARVLRSSTGSYTTDVYANGGGSAYVFSEYEQSGCGYPVIQRIDRSGSLDAGFDATMARTLAKIAPPRGHLRFTPTLVPEGSRGAFLLVGGLDRTCIALAPGAKPVSSGVSVPVNASGQMSRGPKRFASPTYAFDSPAALRLPSGAVVSAAVEYPANGGRAEDVILRTFEPNGSTVHATAPLPTVGLRVSPSLALLSGAAGYVRLVIGLPKEIDVTSVPSAG